MNWKPRTEANQFEADRLSKLVDSSDWVLRQSEFEKLLKEATGKGGEGQGFAVGIGQAIETHKSHNPLQTPMAPSRWTPSHPRQIPRWSQLSTQQCMT